MAEAAPVAGRESSRGEIAELVVAKRKTRLPGVVLLNQLLVCLESLEPLAVVGIILGNRARVANEQVNS